MVTSRRSDAASLASRRSKTGSKITEYNREDYKLIPTAGWPGYSLVGKILAYQLGRKHKGSWLYRRGVIVECFESYSILLPIKTYGGRGCTDLKEEQKTHSAVYVGSSPPFTKQEPSLRVAIKASRLDIENSANPRINYSGEFNLSHTERVREVGQVSGADLQILLDQYREVHGIAQESTAAPSRELIAPPDSRPLLRVDEEDREDSGPQQKGGENGATPARIQNSDLPGVHLLEEAPQAPQESTRINSATTSRTPPSKSARPSRAPLMSKKKKPTPPHAVLNVNPNDPRLQEETNEIPKTPQHDLESLPTDPPPAFESSGPVPSTKPPPQLDKPVKPAQAAPSTEILQERATPPTVAVETPFAEGDHLTPTGVIGSVHDTTSEEVTDPVDLPLFRTVNTAPQSQAVNPDIQALRQLVDSLTREIQETNSVMRELAKKQERRDTFDYTLPPFPTQEMVAALHVPPPPAYTNLPQTMDSILPQQLEKEEPAPPAAAKNKHRAVDGVPPPAPMPPDPSLWHEQGQTYGGHQHHDAAEHDPAYSHYQQSQSTDDQSNYPPESSNAGATGPYTRSPPISSWYRSIWLQDMGFQSKIMVWALVDTGAGANFISEQAVEQLDAKVYPFHGQVTYGNGQQQAYYRSVGLYFGLNTRPTRWYDHFIVAAGLPYDVVFGRELITRLNLFVVNKEMLILAHTKNGKPNEEAIREADRQAEEHDRQVEEQNEREREERRARRAQAQHQLRN